MATVDVQSESAPPPSVAIDLLRRSVKLLSEKSGDAWVKKASISQMIKRLDSTFDPKEHRCESCSDVFDAWSQVIEIRKGESDHMVRWLQADPRVRPS